MHWLTCHLLCFSGVLNIHRRVHYSTRCPRDAAAPRPAPETSICQVGSLLPRPHPERGHPSIGLNMTTNPQRSAYLPYMYCTYIPDKRNRQRHSAVQLAKGGRPPPPSLIFTSKAPALTQTADRHRHHQPARSRTTQADMPTKHAYDLKMSENQTS